MCGIAGAVDLTATKQLSESVLKDMANAIVHRGPDEHGIWQGESVSLASQRLSIVGLADGQQPMTNEDGTVVVVFNGELFDHKNIRTHLVQRGHHFRTGCDTEIIPHLWEEYGEDFFQHLKGQFAFALYDMRQRRLFLARDRFGICPLYWTQQGDWLLFASEIKSLLASGLVPIRPDPRGINHVFTYFSMPGPITCFAGVQALLPGRFLDVGLVKRSLFKGQTTQGRMQASVREGTYWDMDFPDQGDEVDGDQHQLVDHLESLLLRAVEKRLQADVPVVSYLSGGVDSSLIVAMANKIYGRPISTFTIRVDDTQLDETNAAATVAQYVGSDATVIPFSTNDVMKKYPELVQAAESPVIDTSSAATLMLAKAVHAQGYRVALTGEGADEWLAGYPWYKVHKMLSFLDVIPKMKLSVSLRRLYLRLLGLPSLPGSVFRRMQDAVGGYNAWMDIYGLMAMNKFRFFNEPMLQVMRDNVSFTDLDLNQERLTRWHPLNRSLYVGARTLLPGLLLNAKGDRTAMHSSVETRYPFLDEDVFAFLAKLHPRWKMRGFQEKRLLRLLAARWLPKSIAYRRKAMFRSPSDTFHTDRPLPFVDQLLSPESLRKTGYFNPKAVRHWRQAYGSMRPRSLHHQSVEMGLIGVLSTQLWHHMFVDSSLAEIPGWTFARRRTAEVASLRRAS